MTKSTSKRIIELTEPENFEALIELLGYLLEPKFTVSDSGISNKLFNDWNKAGILYQSRAGGENKKERIGLSLLELIWIRLLKILREFGLPYPHLIKIRESLTASISYDPSDPVIQAEMLNYFELLAQNSSSKTAKPSKEELLMVVSEVAKHSNGSEFDLFYSLVANLFQLRLNTRLYVLATGEVEIINDRLSNEPGANEYISGFIDKPHIQISIAHLVADTLSIEKVQDLVSESSLLRSHEEAVLRLMRDSKVREVTIEYDSNKKTKHVDIITRKQFSTTKEMARSLQEKFLSKPYVTLKYSTTKDENVTVEMETRKRVNT